MRISVVKHVEFEGPGLIAAWARSRGHALSLTELALGRPLPELESFDALVLMGGPMSVNDEGRYPWLAPEKELVRRALRSQKKVLGVCLGAQLMASALGARVAPMGYREIGWHPVRATEPEHPWVAGLDPAPSFHWHGEAFELPAGARFILGSEACEAQAFAWGRFGLGLQCHLETDPDALRAMLAHGAAELAEGGRWVQGAADLQALAPQTGLLAGRCERVLDRFMAA